MKLSLNEQTLLVETVQLRQFMWNCMQARYAEKQLPILSSAPQTELRLPPTPHLRFLLALIKHPAPPVCTFPDRTGYKLKLNKYRVGLILNNSVVVPRF